MIKIAEARGLFGGDSGQKKSSTARAQKKREDMVQNRSQSGSAHLKSRKIKVNCLLALPLKSFTFDHPSPTFILSFTVGN